MKHSMSHIATDIGKIVLLMNSSPIHRNWYIHDISRLVLPIVQQGTYKLWDDGFITWTFTTVEAAQGFLQKSRKLIPDDFGAGSIPLIIDWVSLNRRSRQMAREVQSLYPNIKAALYQRKSKERIGVAKWI